MTRSVVIGSTGSFLPARVLSNADLEAIVNTSDEWIRSRTGIRERRIADNDQATSDLSTKAAAVALANAQISPEAVDLIIVGTSSPDMLYPATACLVQKKLGATNAVAFDISAACSSFIYAMSIGEQYLRTDFFKTALIIGGEVVSKITDWQDRSTCILFGDGAGAVVLQQSDNEHRGILGTKLYSNGSQSHLITIPGGGSLNQTSEQTIAQRLHFIKMKGNEAFKVAVKTLTQASIEVLASCNLSIADVDLFIPHQANSRIINAVVANLSLPAAKVCSTIEKYGNTSAASIPITLDEVNQEGKIKPGDLVLLSSFGAGITWGATLIRW